MQDCSDLNDLWKIVHKINHEHFSDNELMPILGNGKIRNPKYMFVFINPTQRNISSSKDWRGPRFPFIGTRQIWRIFNKAELFDDELMEYIDTNSVWTIEFTNKVLKFLDNKSFYFTNIVKWTGHDAALPDKKKIELFLPILQKEIEIVQPKYIITFGLIPFEGLTGKKIKLSEYYEQINKNNKLITYDLNINKTHTNVIPCYFPTGRGNPKRAVEILSKIKGL